MKTLPEGVFYTKITQKGRGLSLQGVAQSNARVSTVMRNINDSKWMKITKLEEIVSPEPGPEGRVSNFKLKAEQTKIDDGKSKDGEESS